MFVVYLSIYPFSNERLHSAVSNNKVDTYNIVADYRVAIYNYK